MSNSIFLSSPCFFHVAESISEVSRLCERLGLRLGLGLGSELEHLRGVAPVREVAEALLPHLERDAVEHVLLLLVLHLVRRALGLLLLLHL